jgi:transglutaminase-like putative cysteine protease
VHAGGISNVALLLLTLAAVYGLARLFTRPLHFFAPVAFVAICVHVTNWLCRRSRLTLLYAAVASAVVTVVTASWVALGHTTAYGIPWRGTYHALGPALQAASDAYRATSAPTAVLPGFVLAGAFGAACAAFLSDWAAFRMRATTEAVLPSFSLFVLSAALAQGHAVVRAGALWLAALLVFLLVRQAAVDSPSAAWFASRSRRGPTTILAVGGVITVCTVTLAAVLAPHLPGATVHSLIDWRHSGSGGPSGRDTASPLVDLNARLHQLSQQEVFTVQTDEPTYYRLTALSTFSGSGWSLDDTYRSVHSDLPAVDTGPDALPPDAGPALTVTATFHISALQSLWLAAPYRPVRLTGVGGLSWSAAAASVITNKPTSNGLSYTVTSDVPDAGPAELRTSPKVDTSDPALRKYLELPDNIDPRVEALATHIVAGTQTPYDAALQIQNYLRSPPFRYDLNVPAGQSQSALVDFLFHTRAGFCQQFAGAYAVLAREAGLPARVAVGFTEGYRDSQGYYHVKDEDAHAWPEVWFGGIGWVAFEPTPDRGSPDPSSQAVTGVSPAQAPDLSPPITAAGPSTVAPASPALPPTLGKGGAGGAPTTTGHHRSWWRTSGLVIVGILLVAALLWVAALVAAGAALRSRRRRLARAPAAQVALAWSQAREALTDRGVPPFAWETPDEFAARAAETAALPAAAGDALARLAAIEDVAAYSGAEPSAADVSEAAAASVAVADAARADRGRWPELWARGDPRPVWRAARAARAEARAARADHGPTGTPPRSGPPDAAELDAYVS